jgi:hypothetical protein
MAEAGRNVNGLTPDDHAEPPAWGLFLKRGNLSNRGSCEASGKDHGTSRNLQDFSRDIFPLIC